MQAKERKVLGLQTEITDLNNDIAVKESENTQNIQTMKVLQDKQRGSAREVSPPTYLLYVNGSTFHLLLIM